MLVFHHSVVRIPFALMPVFLLAAQPAAISLVSGAAKVNPAVKMRASAEKWDSLWQSIKTLCVSLTFSPFPFLNFGDTVVTDFLHAVIFLFRAV